jgi:hypothetical protein
VRPSLTSLRRDHFCEVCGHCLQIYICKQCPHFSYHAAFLLKEVEGGTLVLRLTIAHVCLMTHVVAAADMRSS